MTFADLNVPVGSSETHASSTASAAGASARGPTAASTGAASTRATGRRSIRSASCPSSSRSIIDSSATVGIRGTKSQWFWDASAQYGHNSFDFNVTNSLNVSLGPTIPPNQTEFYAGTPRVQPVHVQPRRAARVRGRPVRPAQRRGRGGAAPRELPDRGRRARLVRRGHQPRPVREPGPARARRSSPASVPPTRWTRTATTSPPTSTSRATWSAACGSAWPDATSTTATSAARPTAS